MDENLYLTKAVNREWQNGLGNAGADDRIDPLGFEHANENPRLELALNLGDLDRLILSIFFHFNLVSLSFS